LTLFTSTSPLTFPTLNSADPNPVIPVIMPKTFLLRTFLLKKVHTPVLSARP